MLISISIRSYMSTPVAVVATVVEVDVCEAVQVVVVAVEVHVVDHVWEAVVTTTEAMIAVRSIHGATNLGARSAITVMQPHDRQATAWVPLVRRMEWVRAAMLAITVSYLMRPMTAGTVVATAQPTPAMVLVPTPPSQTWVRSIVPVYHPAAVLGWRRLLCLRSLTAIRVWH
uniref:Putative secreted protein n=1 Tax=Anopheles marajoara TaxID=58244 RepID=A0A2M4C5Z0_9DIPT